MVTKDILQMLIGLLVTLGLIALAFSFPNYKVYTAFGSTDYELVRRARWNAPNMYGGPQTSDQSNPATSKKTTKFEDPTSQVRELQIKATPIYFHLVQYRGDRNLLSLFVQAWVACYIAFVIFKFINRG